MKSRLAGICIAAAVLVGCVAIPASSAGATNYRGVQKIANSLDKTYAQIKSELNSPTASTNTLDGLFLQYSNECILFAAYGSTNGSQVALDILNVAKIGNGWAWIGYITLNTNSSMSSWRAANVALSNAEAKFAKDVRAE
jgi:hypothetical protein